MKRGCEKCNHEGFIRDFDGSFKEDCVCMSDKIYISGKMSGLPDNNYPKFNEVEQDLKSKGYEVVNPAKLEHNHGQTYEEFMREDLKALLECDSILMIKGWEDSTGALMELNVARICGIKVFYEGDL